MGRGVVYNTLVVAPGLFDAAVAFAPVSARPEENIDQFQRLEGGPADGRDRVGARHPATNPEFWREVSPLTYLDRVTDPLLIHHGTADTTCPLRWTRQTVAAFEKAGKDVELRTHHGKGRTFSSRWARSMETTVDLFEEHLR